ncbi:uncharacterized protein LOC117113434 isoform X2 [Anneissia japonica]|uniref:uncharacterized protein LOC117113434 isoform X1 n=1 Tax=Anneissia japonica TaxID=1529436 RepID=UPI001425A9FB|nr:uncharacterized protein LOC117113434 isoform X1 [Anneissia japonica]XP_033112657.1 uncharacterized protein LOC117113434 isoform X2 [Anneissia japonica]
MPQVTSRGKGGGRGNGGGRGKGRRRWANNRGNQGGAKGINKEKPIADPVIEIEEKDLRQLFTSNCHLDQHYSWQEKNRQKYLATLLVLKQNGAEIKDGSKVKALAAGFARHDHDLTDTLLKTNDLCGVVEVLKALTILDSKRKQFELEKKIEKLMENKEKNAKTIRKLKSNMDSAQALRPTVGSVSGALCRHIQRWVRTLSTSKLEFYALYFPKDKWRKLADICHLNPERDFPECTWFLPYCFGAPAPEGSVVSACTELNKANVNELLQNVKIPFAHLKEFKNTLTTDSKITIAKYTSLDTILWNYEDLACPGVNNIILEYLEKEQTVGLPYGKLMERLLMLKLRMKQGESVCFFKKLIPIAEVHLKKIEVPLQAPVVVIGDMSPSMGVAIRVSTIIASLFAVLTKAKLVFFHQINYTPPSVPKTTNEVLELATTLQTTGSTCPASSLWRFYKNKEVVKTFVVVTDEEENTNYKGYSFTELFKLYYKEVNKARLVFVSFLRSQHVTGEMVSKLQAEGIEVMQFKLDSQRPDLNKLDNLLGLLSVESAAFDVQVDSVESDICEQGLQKTIQNLKL